MSVGFKVYAEPKEYFNRSVQAGDLSSTAIAENLVLGLCVSKNYREMYLIQNALNQIPEKEREAVAFSLQQMLSTDLDAYDLEGILERVSKISQRIEVLRQMKSMLGDKKCNRTTFLQMLFLMNSVSDREALALAVVPIQQTSRNGLNVAFLSLLIKVVDTKEWRLFIQNFAFLNDSHSSEIQSISSILEDFPKEEVMEVLKLSLTLRNEEKPELSLWSMIKLIGSLSKVDRQAFAQTVESWIKQNKGSDGESAWLMDVIRDIPLQERAEVVRLVHSLTNESMERFHVLLILEAVSAIPAKKRELTVASALSTVGTDADATKIRKALGAMPHELEAEPAVRWHEFTRRVTEEERDALMRGIEEVEAAQVDRFVQGLENDLNDPFFNQKGVHWIALRALKDGKISPFQAGSFLVSLSMRERGGKRVPLFINEQINPAAVDILRKSFNLEYLDDVFERRLSEAIQEIEKEARKNGSFSEYWLSLADRERNGGNNMYGAVRSILPAFVHPFLHEGREKVSFPSFAIIQAFVNITYPFPARINPVIGYSKDTDILQNGWSRTRDVGVRFPGVYLPALAHDLDASDEQFTIHDLGHVFIVANIPDRHRRRFMKIANLFRPYEDKTVRDAGFNYFIDLDAPNTYYRMRMNGSWEAKFRNHLMEGAIRNPNLRMDKLKESDLEKISRFVQTI